MTLQERFDDSDAFLAWWRGRPWWVKAAAWVRGQVRRIAN